MSKPSMPVVSLERTMTISEITAIVNYVATHKMWVVILCPNREVLEHARKAVAGAVPRGSSGNGRTFTLLNRSRISVTEATTAVFVPDDEPYSALFLGWDKAGKATLTGMARWHAKASQVLGARA